MFTNQHIESIVQKRILQLTETELKEHQKIAVSRLVSVLIGMDCPQETRESYVDLREKIQNTPQEKHVRRIIRLQDKKSCFLGDEMGLGKTLTTLMSLFICKTINQVFLDEILSESEQIGKDLIYKNFSHQTKPILIVANTSIIGVWKHQIELHFPQFCNTELYYHYWGIFRKQRFQEVLERDTLPWIIFVTYDTFASDLFLRKRLRNNENRCPLFNCNWSAFVMDEIHKVRNGSISFNSLNKGSQCFQSLRMLSMTFPNVPKIGISGTLLCNRRADIGNLCLILFPFNKTLSSEKFWLQDDNFTLEVLQNFKKYCIIRRTFRSLNFYLPSLHKFDVAIDANEIEKTKYLRRFLIFELIFMKYSNSLKANNLKRKKLSSGEIRRRLKISRDLLTQYYMQFNLLILQTLHSELFPYKDKDISDFTNVISSKEGKILEIMATKDATTQWIIASDSVVFLKHFKLILEERDHLQSVEIFHGELSMDERYEMIKQFESNEIDVFLLSSKTGNEGITLTNCQNMILVNSGSDLNPQNENQLVARIHRIGQERECFLWRLLMTKTTDIAISQHIQPYKRQQFQQMVECSETLEYQEEKNDVSPKSLFGLIRDCL
jgi:SNF2 family DNA or RNA helicase